MFTRSDGGADMNAINHKRYRLLTVLLLVAAGLLTAVITGCGGGGGGGDGASDTGPTLAITADNGEAENQGLRKLYRPGRERCHRCSKKDFI